MPQCLYQKLGFITSARLVVMCHHCQSFTWLLGFDLGSLCLCDRQSTDIQFHSPLVHLCHCYSFSVTNLSPSLRLWILFWFPNYRHTCLKPKFYIVLWGTKHTNSSKFNVFKSFLTLTVRQYPEEDFEIEDRKIDPWLSLKKLNFKLEAALFWTF